MPATPTPQDTVRSIVRSLTPWVLSGVIAISTRLGLNINPQVSAELFAAIGTGLTIGLRALEAKYPWVGKLLGFSGAPMYPPTKKQQTAQTIAALEAQVAALQAAQTQP
jgi:hypothetical protein